MYLFIKKNCAKCKSAAYNLSSCRIPFEYVDIQTKEGFNLAKRFNIGNVPTLTSDDGIVLDMYNIPKEYLL